MFCRRHATECLEGRWGEDRVVHMYIRGDLQPHGKRPPDRLETIKIQFSFTLGRGGDLAGKVFARRAWPSKFDPRNPWKGVSVVGLT